MFAVGAAGTSAVFAFLALHASQQAVSVARDTEKRQLRAYVIVSAQKITNVGESERPHIQAIFENMGQTPVYDSVWTSGIGVRGYPSFERTEKTWDQCSSILDKPNNQKWYFGKNALPDTDASDFITGPQLANVQNGKSAIYFIGRVCYRDIFRDIHYTDFCIFWAWDKGGLGPAIYCRKGNEAGSEGSEDGK